MEKPAENLFPIHEVLQKRWSPRSFSSTPIEPEKVASLFEAARWSPSSSNLQPWSFIVASKSEESSYTNLRELLSERNSRWAGNAPVLIITVANMTRSPGQPNNYAWYDLGQAVAHLTMQAGALGLFVHQMGGFDRVKAREVVKIPEGYEPVTMLAIGYLGALENLPEDLQQRELQDRQRKPMQEFVFDGQWNIPLQLALKSITS